MKDQFSGYYAPDAKALDTLWSEGVIIFDTNVLLNLYRYPADARNDFLTILRKLTERLWIPHQVAFEFQRNRRAVIASQMRRFGDVRKILKDTEDSLSTQLENLQLKRRHSSINTDRLLEQVHEVFEGFLSELKELEDRHLDISQEDEIREQLDEIFRGKIGPAPASQEELNKIFDEGKSRYAANVPPGYLDKPKERTPEGVGSTFNGLRVDRQYGDLIMWFQVIAEAKARSAKHIILVTDEDSTDWWWVVQSRGPKTVGRPELLEEIKAKAGVENFYMYNSDRFMKFASEKLGASVKPESIEQVREIRSTLKSTSRWKFGKMAVSAVSQWLSLVHAQATFHAVGNLVVAETNQGQLKYQFAAFRNLAEFKILVPIVLKNPVLGTSGLIIVVDREIYPIAHNLIASYEPLPFKVWLLITDSHGQNQGGAEFGLKKAATP